MPYGYPCRATIEKFPLNESYYWRAGCIERCTSGSEGDGWKRAARYLASRLPYFAATGKNGNPREDENTATEAYSQAFRRACAKFGLGRYLYDLPRLKLPYDPRSRSIAISAAERIAWVEKLYMEHGLQPRGYPTPQPPGARVATPKQGPAVSETVAAPPMIQPQAAVPKAAPPSGRHPKTSTAETPASQPHTPSGARSPNGPRSPRPIRTTRSSIGWPRPSRDSVRIQGICDFYQVAALARLNATQRMELTKRLQQQVNQQQSPSA